MHRLFAEEGPPATGWGGEGFARQLRGPTFAGSCMDSPSVPPPHHLYLLQLTHVPASNKCSEQPLLLLLLLSPLSHKPEKNKKDTQKLPWLPSGLPGQESGREDSEKRYRERKERLVRMRRGGRAADPNLCIYLFILHLNFAQVSFPQH